MAHALSGDSEAVTATGAQASSLHLGSEALTGRLEACFPGAGSVAVARCDHGQLQTAEHVLPFRCKDLQKGKEKNGCRPHGLSSHNVTAFIIRS